MTSTTPTPTPTPKRPYIVLASVELDATASEALSQAFRMLGARGDAELHLVHVVVSDGQGSAEQLVQVERRMAEAPDRIREYLNAHWAGADEVKVVVHLRVGNDPAHQVLQTAVDVQADLLVVGSHRRRGLQKLLLGSVAERILREAHCPVMVALPKNYDRQHVSDSIEPPCPDCVQRRVATENKEFWCERHSRKYSRPHVYEPSDARRNSVMPSV